MGSCKVERVGDWQVKNQLLASSSASVLCSIIGKCFVLLESRSCWLYCGIKIVASDEAEMSYEGLCNSLMCVAYTICVGDVKGTCWFFLEIWSCPLRSSCERSQEELVERVNSVHTYLHTYI